MESMLRAWLAVTLLMSVSACAHAPKGRSSPTVSETAPASQPVSVSVKVHPALAFLSDPLATWPLIQRGVESRYFSSFDRTGGNDDGFRGTYSALYTLSSGEQVIFDALGPGVLQTLWFTGPREGGEGLDLGRLRFYFDDEKRARIVTDVGSLFGGRQEPFVAPLVRHNKQSTGGFVSWVPIPYQGRLIITTERRPSFYIAQYDTLPPDTRCPSWRPELDYTPVRRTFEAAGQQRLPGELKAIPLHYRHQGSGTIEAIQLEPKPGQRGRLHKARIRLHWDGETTPGVDLPLGTFFGSGLGEADVRSLAFSMKDGSYENRLPMPFWNGFELRIVGIEGKLRIGIGPARFDRRTAGHLRAIYSDASPTVEGEDFQWLHIKGTGKLVGTTLTIRPPTPQTKRWWEGDLRSYADGRRTPGLHGTGHEDDHLGGWSNTFFSRPFSLPMHGEPRVELIERQGVQYNARITLYRLWPGITFLGELRHSVEHGSRNRVQASYAGAAFYYALAGPSRLKEADRLDISSAVSRERHGLKVDGKASKQRLRSAFEGRWDRRPMERGLLVHNGEARFKITIPAENNGCLLRRTYDQKQGRQRAAVLVNGKQVADWYVAEGNPHLRWAERDLFLPPSVTRGRSELQISLRPREGHPPWNAAEYRVLCVEHSGS